MQEDFTGVARLQRRSGERSVKDGTAGCFQGKCGLEMSGPEELDFVCQSNNPVWIWAFNFDNYTPRGRILNVLVLISLSVDESRLTVDFSNSNMCCFLYAAL